MRCARTKRNCYMKSKKERILTDSSTNQLSRRVCREDPLLPLLLKITLEPLQGLEPGSSLFLNYTLITKIFVFLYNQVDRRNMKQFVTGKL
jgi:hypothetical protein